MIEVLSRDRTGVRSLAEVLRETRGIELTS